MPLLPPIVAGMNSLLMNVEKKGGYSDPAVSGTIEPEVHFGSFIDDRDGRSYKTTTIGTMVWMAENLNFSIEGSSCYGDNLMNCETYGRLYRWVDAKVACPSGWGLPTRDAFEALLENVSKQSSDLMARNWGTGTDRYGFAALPAGRYDYRKKAYIYLDAFASFWSSTEISYSRAYSLYIKDDSNGSNAYVGTGEVGDRLSVRCLLKD